MTYVKTIWANEPAGGTPIHATPLNNIESGIFNALPRWKPSTAYAYTEQVVSPNNDVVSAAATHTSGLTFVAANWTLSPTYALVDTQLHSVGEGTIPRLAVTSANALLTGQLLLTYFTARKTETVNTVRTITDSIAAATPTLCKVGIYSVAVNGDLTLVASSANDVTAWAATFTAYSRTVAPAWAKVAGQRYALATLYVGTTSPKLKSVAALTGTEMGIAPRLNGSLAAQTDLPATIPAGSITDSQGISIYAVVLP